MFVDGPLDDERGDDAADSCANAAQADPARAQASRKKLAAKDVDNGEAGGNVELAKLGEGVHEVLARYPSAEKAGYSGYRERSGHDQSSSYELHQPQSHEMGGNFYGTGNEDFEVRISRHRRQVHRDTVVNGVYDEPGEAQDQSF